jgi:hypothetical protein
VAEVGLPIPVTASVLHQAGCVLPVSVEGALAAVLAAPAAESELASWHGASLPHSHTATRPPPAESLPRAACRRRPIGLSLSRCSCLRLAALHTSRPLPASEDDLIARPGRRTGRHQPGPSTHIGKCQPEFQLEVDQQFRQVYSAPATRSHPDVHPASHLLSR